MHSSTRRRDESSPEVVRTVLTSDDVHATVRDSTLTVRKHPVDCDRAGFIVNALLFPYLNNAVKMVQEHYASLDDIDAAMKLGRRLSGWARSNSSTWCDASSPSRRCCTVRASRLAPHRCSNTWWPWAASAARWPWLSANMPGAEPGTEAGAGWAGCSSIGRPAYRERLGTYMQYVRGHDARFPGRPVLPYTRHDRRLRCLLDAPESAASSVRGPAAQDAPRARGRGDGAVRH